MGNCFAVQTPLKVGRKDHWPHVDRVCGGRILYNQAQCSPEQPATGFVYFPRGLAGCQSARRTLAGNSDTSRVRGFLNCWKKIY